MRAWGFGYIRYRDCSRLEAPRAPEPLADEKIAAQEAMTAWLWGRRFELGRLWGTGYYFGLDGEAADSGFDP